MANINLMESINTLEDLKKKIDESGLTVVSISDIGCSVCLAITPELEDLAKKYSNAVFMQVDTKDIPEIAGEFLVFVYPTIIIFAEGKETKRFERVFSMFDIEAHIARLHKILFEPFTSLDI